MHAARRELSAEMKRVGATREEVVAVCIKLFGKSSSANLSVAEMKKLTANLAAEIMAGAT